MKYKIGFAIFLVLCWYRVASCEPVFREDFSSLESWTTFKDLWPEFGGEYEPGPGGLVLQQPDGDSPMGGFLTADEELLDLEDVSIRTEVSQEGPSFRGIGLVARATVPNTWYQGGYNPTLDRLYLGYNSPFFNFFATHYVGHLNLSEGVHVQLDVVDETLSLWVWEVNGAAPEEPQLVYTDEEIGLAFGTIGVSFDPDSPGTHSTATFEYIDVFDSSRPFQRGDFNWDGSLDVTDIELLSAEVRAATHRESFDLTGNGLVDMFDRDDWVHDRRRTFFGDANLDGEFDSSDLLAVFQSGQYEDHVAMNSTWATGDWNGDREFNSGDLVRAFQDGGYEQGQRVDANAVPEPSSLVVLIAGLSAIAVGLRRRGR